MDEELMQELDDVCTHLDGIHSQLAGIMSEIHEIGHDHSGLFAETDSVDAAQKYLDLASDQVKASLDWLRH
jgi:hypothetical protein